MTVRFVTTIQQVDEKQASAWLANRYEHQRNVNHQHVADLARAMYDGKFSPVGSVKLSFSNGSGEPHLIDGQHTMLAIIKSKRPQTLPIVYYTCDTEREEAELYYRTDKVRRRTLSDSMRVTELPGHLGLTATQIRDAASALRHIKTNFGASSAWKHHVSEDDLLEWLPQWAWATKEVYKAISPCTARERNMVLRKAVLSVALVTMRDKPRESRAFWSQVARDDGLERNDPRKTLRAWLLEAQQQGKAPGSKLRNNELSRGAILAWNAYIEGRKLKFISIHDRSGVVRILGTDYSGHQSSDYIPLYDSQHDGGVLVVDDIASEETQVVMA